MASNMGLTQCNMKNGLMINVDPSIMDSDCAPSLRMLLAAASSNSSNKNDDSSMEKDRAISNDTMGLSTVSFNLRNILFIPYIKYRLS